MICILTVKFITRKEKFPVNMFTACLNIFMLAMINILQTNKQTNNRLMHSIIRLIFPDSLKNDTKSNLSFLFV